ncbi:MAG: DUF4159 domain-containing protein [Deltaproteobacteria bacterium]|nr:DUF4159 domain-containing protein [Deltaproteobacteria bacterium]
MNRRDFLKGIAVGAAAALWPGRVRAFGDTSKYIPAVARHGGRWDTRPNGLRRLCWEVSQRTSAEVFPEARPFGLADQALFRYPFLYFGGEGPFPPLSPDEVGNLRRWITWGGFMLADANDGSNGDGFDASFRREIARVLPGSPLSRLSADHVVYRSYYLLDRHGGRLLVRPFMEAAMVGRRAAVIYSQNDLAGAWSRDEHGDWDFQCSPGGESQREVALRTGINLVFYALCLDYKEDAVHLPFIMKRRR